VHRACEQTLFGRNMERSSSIHRNAGDLQTMAHKTATPPVGSDGQDSLEQEGTLDESDTAAAEHLRARGSAYAGRHASGAVTRIE
jgi:hypothetical protein